MDFLFYYVLRRFFVSVKTDVRGLTLRKGLIFRRLCFIPVEVITTVRIKRTPLLRLLHASKVTVSALGGKVSFYIKQNEKLGFLPQQDNAYRIRHKFSSIMFGAFCETKALGGTIIFSATLVRIGNVLGSGYYNRIISTINKTAEDLDRVLSAMRIAVPKLASVLAVFIAASWLFAFVRKLVQLYQFSISIGNRFSTASHGLFTLYEDIVVHNDLVTTFIPQNAAAILFGAAPIHCGYILFALPMKKKKQSSVLRLLLGCDIPYHPDQSPPKEALFGHIAVPFGWGITNAAALLLCYITGADPILRTILWSAVWICIWYCVLFAIFMKRTGLTVQNNDLCIISARHGLALHTAFVPKGNMIYRRKDTNPIQAKKGMCDIRIFCRGKYRQRLRNMYDQRT